jgi:2'-5' RNA ligase
MRRCFVAVDLPETFRARLAEIALPTGARAVPAEQIHLTLRFAGNLNEAEAGSGASIAALIARLSEISLARFELAADGPGTFPPVGPPNVLWLGLKASQPLLALKAAIDAAAEQIGVAKDERPFAAHLTVARLKQVERAALEGSLEALAKLEGTALPVRSFTLYSSVLSHAGATHTVERRFALQD